MRLGVFVFVLLSSAFLAHAANADESVHRLSLRDVLVYALTHHPALTTTKRQEGTAEARVDVAHAEAIPRIGLAAQLNRSTGNVVPGATFGVLGVPTIAGPPGAERLGSGTWQSLTAVTVGWDLLELVRRPALVEAAERDVSAVKAQADVARLAVAANAADAFFALAETRALVVAAETSEKRAQTFYDVVATLAGQKLRPELDLARAETELAAAKIAAEKARLSRNVAGTRLGEAIGELDWSLDVVDGEYADLPSSPASLSGSLATDSPSLKEHPDLIALDRSREAANARARVEKLALMPRVELAGAAWLRGSGYVLGGPNSGDLGGVLPDTPNWALGVVVTWLPADIASGNAKSRVETAQGDTIASRAAEAKLVLTAEVRVARASLLSSLAVAQSTKTAVAAAKKAHTLATTRYANALGTVLEVADAERALAAAERDDAVARFEAWRALVALYRAEGNLEPLFGAAGKGKG
jgi:multidrug efflux system outer membrane protein